MLLKATFRLNIIFKGKSRVLGIFRKYFLKIEKLFIGDFPKKYF